MTRTQRILESMAIKRTTKKEIKRVHSLRKLSHSSAAPRGQYFVAPDGKAYVCDTPGIMGVKEVTEFTKKMREDLQAQLELI